MMLAYLLHVFHLPVIVRVPMIPILGFGRHGLEVPRAVGTELVDGVLELMEEGGGEVDLIGEDVGWQGLPLPLLAIAVSITRTAVAGGAGHGVEEAAEVEDAAAEGWAAGSRRRGESGIVGGGGGGGARSLRHRSRM